MLAEFIVNFQLIASCSLFLQCSNTVDWCTDLYKILHQRSTKERNNVNMWCPASVISGKQTVK